MGKPTRNFGPCSEEGCNRPAACKGKCRACYNAEWARNKLASDPAARDRKRAANRQWASKRPFMEPAVTEKRCGECATVKPAAEFYLQRRGGDGLQSVCIECSKAQQAAYALTRRCRNVGITVEQYEALWEAQGGLCGLCGRRPATDLDHCHATGRFRGLVCAACNRVLATVGDDSVLLRKQADYVDSGGASALSM